MGALLPGRRGSPDSRGPCARISLRFFKEEPGERGGGRGRDFRKTTVAEFRHLRTWARLLRGDVLPRTRISEQANGPKIPR